MLSRLEIIGALFSTTRSGYPILSKFTQAPMNTSQERIKPQIESSWHTLLNDEFNAESFVHLKHFLTEEKKNYTIYPPGKEIFTAFNHTSVDKVKAVILGQDPYHGPGQAHGLCFSVKDGIKPPPSLVNIYKEMKSDLGYEAPSHGNLISWADQGVLLLNATLTVRASEAGSHQGKGWEEFTDEVIRKISMEKKHLVFLLWGRFAQAKSELIDSRGEHLILKAAHPSPFSARNGFFGCQHFSKTNEFLEKHNIKPIDWNLNGL